MTRYFLASAARPLRRGRRSSAEASVRASDGRRGTASRRECRSAPYTGHILRPQRIRYCRLLHRSRRDKRSQPYIRIARRRGLRGRGTRVGGDAPLGRPQALRRGQGRREAGLPARRLRSGAAPAAAYSLVCNRQSKYKSLPIYIILYISHL